MSMKSFARIFFPYAILLLGCTQTIDYSDENEVSPMLRFEGTADSNIVPFTWNTCSWTIQFRNIDLAFSIENRTRIMNVSLQNDADERSTTCASAPFQRQTYLYASGSVEGNIVTLNFTPGNSNLPKCNAKFVGTISGNAINGILTWNRFDQSGTLNYEIKVPVQLKVSSRTNAGTTASITFSNNSFTPVDITFGGVTKTIDVKATAVFTGRPSTSVTGEAVTFGKTTSGTQVGGKITWKLSYSFPPNGNVNIDLNVANDYFFLFVSNNSSKTINKVFVNFGLQSQTLDNLSLPGNGTKYSVGYYRAWNNSNARFETGDGTFYWEYGSLPLSFLENQSVSLTAN